MSKMGERLLNRRVQDGLTELRVPAGIAPVEEIWVNGVKVAAATWNSDPAKPWLQINMATNPWTVTEQPGPPPDVWGANDMWRRKDALVWYPYVD